MRTYTENQVIAILDHIERNGFNDDCMTMNDELEYLNSIGVVKNCSIPDVCESLPEEIENWYAKQTNRNVEEFDDYDKHICNVVLKWQQQVNSVDLADVVLSEERTELPPNRYICCGRVIGSGHTLKCFLGF